MTCCACRERPALLFGAYCCQCYWHEPPAYLAACRGARDRGEPHPDEQALTSTEATVLGIKARWADPVWRDAELARRRAARP